MSSASTKSIYAFNLSTSPYKQAVTNPTSSSSTNEYTIRFTEHLLLTSCKPPLPTNIISSIVQKSFGRHQFATDDLRKSQKFYELIPVSYTHLTLPTNREV